jgi:UDP-N-acetyl-2-amino-2-deoxyglucuronate dehydrogenase
MLTVALIGCGRISFKHIEAFIKNSARMRLVATCDPVPERARAKRQEYLKAFPDASVETFADFREMLARAKPDLVTIATESGLHPAIAVECLKAGCHVICEKPMALSTADADAMIAAAAAAGRKLGVCFQNRFNAPVQKARAAYEAGRFGRMLHGMIQVRWTRDAAYYAEAPWRGTWALDGGTLMNQCTHGIDLLQWMMGEDVVRVHGATRRFLRPIEAEDFGGALLEFRSGAVGIVEGSADIFPSNLNETISLFGSSGSVVIGGLAVNKIETWRFSDAAEVGDTEDKVLNPSDKDPPTVYGFGHAALFADFADAVERGREPLVTGAGGKKALDVILGIYKSMKEGRPVDLPFEFSTMEMKDVFRGNHG